MNSNFKLHITEAVSNGSLKIIAGKRMWYKYFLIVTELRWARNNHDGYIIDVYKEEYGTHLLRVII